ncbi:sterol desaturase family protein [Methyloferula stellata]|uniref:sterol desaturase family protein n=1 Tax=Methyloferula stellata TaxID=876270 RepID=UPI00036FD401|nr:sterol desaturase family protein [Methyloferula stellata]
MVDLFFRHSDTAQILIFAVCFALVGIVERICVGLPDAAVIRHMSLNALFVFIALPLELVVGVICFGVSRWATDHHFGLMFLQPAWLGLALRSGIVFVLLDLGDYVYHRIMHHTPWLWCFHLVHHTDQIVDSSTTVREHPGETIVRGSFLVLWTLVLGASEEVLLLRQAAESVFAVLSHSAVRMPREFGTWFGFVFVSPNLHHVHHHRALPYTDRNFGGVFSVWDRLFGTFVELEQTHCAFGLDTHGEAQSCARFGSLMTMPIWPKEGRLQPPSGP